MKKRKNSAVDFQNGVALSQRSNLCMVFIFYRHLLGDEVHIDENTVTNTSSHDIKSWNYEKNNAILKKKI